MIAACYFDGVDARLHPVELHVDDATVAIAGAGDLRSYARASATLAPAAGAAPALLYLPDGGVCEVHGAERAALARALAWRTPWTLRLQQHAAGAVLVLMLLVGLIGAGVARVLPALAALAVHAVPDQVDRHLGKVALDDMVDNHALQPSRVAPARAREAAQVLALVTPAQPRMRMRVLLFDAPAIGVNAISLPDGTIVVTDQLMQSLTGPAGTLGPQQRAALAGIMAHEVSHTEHRDTVRGLLGDSMAMALAGFLLGDFSEATSDFSGDLVSLHHARRIEAEADGYAIDMLHQRGMFLTPMADWLDRCDAWYAALENGKQRAVPVYFQTHPLTAERSARLRAADRK